MMQYKSKLDYQKYAIRSDVHTTIREDLYEKLQIFSIKQKQPQSKITDVILQMIFENEELLSELKNRIRTY